MKRDRTEIQDHGVRKWNKISPDPLRCKTRERGDDELFHTPDELIPAAQNGNIEVLRMTLRNEFCSPNQRDNGGVTALMWASKNGHSSAAELLLTEPRTDPNLSENRGFTALMIASFFGQCH